MTFPYKEILPLFDPSQVTCLYLDIWNLFPFFVYLYKKRIVICFSDSTAQKQLNNQMAAVLLQVIPSFFSIRSKNRLLCAIIYGKCIVRKKICIAHHNDKICFQANCRYHIILKGDIKELLQKLHTFCFKWYWVYCLYTLFKHQFVGKIFVNRAQRFDSVQRKIHFNHQNRRMGRMPRIKKKSFLRKN